MSIYSEFAKISLKMTEGEHPISETEAHTLLAIGYALVSIADELEEIHRELLKVRMVDHGQA